MSIQEKKVVKKIWLILLCLAALLILLYLLWSASGYLLSEQEQSKPELPREVTLIHSDPPGIGEIVPVQAEFKLPRYREILHISVTPGKGTVVSRSAEAKKIKRSWKYDFYRLEGFICCIRPGESKTGSITVELSPAQKGAAPEKFLLTIPTLKIKELPPLGSGAPELAPEVPLPPKEFPRRHLLWLLLLIIPAGLWLVLKKRKKQAVPLSLRQRTLGALDSLRAGVFARRLTACEGIAGISDLLRNYLEERYALPASGKTTPEFLDEMEFHSALPARAGNFLRTFLNAADMIKFAQAPCDAAAVSTAVESAVELVKSTSDAEKEEQ